MIIVQHIILLFSEPNDGQHNNCLSLGILTNANIALFSSTSILASPSSFRREDSNPFISRAARFCAPDNLVSSSIDWGVASSF